MKKILWGFSLLFLVNIANAQTAKDKFIQNDDWHYQADTKNGKVYLKGIVKNGNTYDYWMKIQNNKLECDKNAFGLSPMDKLLCDQSKEIKEEKSVTHYILSCKNRKIKSTNSVSYNYLGDIVDSNSKEGKWQAIFPDSIGEDISKTLCK